MKNQYVMDIINNCTFTGVPLIYKGETIMVYRSKSDFRVITAYYANLTETDVYKMITTWAKTIQTYGNLGSTCTCLTASLDAHGLDMLISLVDKIGGLPRFSISELRAIRGSNPKSHVNK